jgi:arsenate reductase
MAEGLIRTLYPDRYEAYSAGTEPSHVNRYVIKVMAEIGINISRYRSKGLNEFLNSEFDYLITVCDHAKQTCPFFPGGKEFIHRGFEDPAAFSGSEEQKMATFRRVRDEIREWIVETFGGEGERERLK